MKKRHLVLPSNLINNKDILTIFGAEISKGKLSATPTFLKNAIH